MRLAKVALITLAVCIGIPVILFGIFYMFPKPAYYAYSYGTYLVSPKYKEMSSIDEGNVWYECLKPIKVEKRFIKVGHLGGSAYQFLYLPVNESDLANFCRMTGIE
jgi:hypothetical protein